MFRYEEFNIYLVGESHPREVMVEVTRRCNLSCLYCFRDDLGVESFIDMDRSMFSRLLDTSLDAGVHKFAFTGWGEPLVHPDILDFIRSAKEYGLEVLINTNAFFLKEFGDGLVQLGVDELVVSIDSDDEDIYRNIRRGEDLSRVVEGLEVVNKAKRTHRSNKPIIKFQYTLNKINIGNVMSLARLAREYRVKNVIISNIIPNNPYTAKLLQCLGDSSCIDVIDRLKDDLVRVTLDTNINFYVPETSIKTERRCPFMERDAVYVTAEGDVAPCIFYAHRWSPIINGIRRKIYPVRFGNINESSLNDVWRSEDYIRFRFNVRFSYMPSCLDCKLENVCTVTRSNKYDCWGNSPTCSHCPYSRNVVYCPL